MVKMASLESLTDGELRTELSRLGYPVGPITATTKKVLLKKLKLLLEQSKSDVDSKRKSAARFSSGDESEDDAKHTRKSMPPPKKTPPTKTTRRRSASRLAATNSQENDSISSVSTVLNSSGNGPTNSSPEKVYSPTSFSDNFLRGKKSSTSFLSSLSGRRSYRSDLENSNNSFNAYDTGSDTDVNEAETSSSKSSSFISQNRFSRGEGSFSRSLGVSKLSTSYVPAVDSLKHRFLGSKSANEDSTSPTSMNNDGFENSYSDINRRFTRPSQPSSSYVNRLGGSLTTSLGLSNVKESDDEEPIRNPVTQTQFSNRSRYDRWTLDSPWWKSTSLVSMGLITVFICFFALIFVSYINVKWKDSNISTPDTHFPICKGNVGKPGVNCIVESDVRAVMDIFRKIYQVLNEHVSRVKCEDSTNKSGLTKTQLGQLLIENNADMSIWEIEQQYDNLQVLINANPQWGVKISKDEFDLLEPSLPLYCLIKHNVIYLVWFIVRLIIAVFVLYLLKRGFNWWMYKKEEHKKEVFKLVEAIVDLLSTHSQNCGDRDTFLAVDHVRDQLIPPEQRYSMSKLWDDAVAYLANYESRVRSEVQQVAGEECHVWRWLPTNSRRKMWQGQAFETQEGSVNSLTVSPTPCLKIRHMFDPDVEVGDEWMVHVKDAILEKCEGINVLHIAVDKGSLEGCVYLKCSSPEEAGKAFRALHGSWFDSKLVTVKYLRLGRYHERFPDAVRSSRPLRPSNNHKMSLQ